MNRLSAAAFFPALRRGLLFVYLASIFCAAGCRREQIVSYRVPKETADSASPITYKLPSGWQEKTPAGMSLASFSFGNNQAELSVMSFPGEGASQLNLVNIVRENMGLPPLSDAELAKLVQPVSIGGEAGSLIDLSAGTGSTTNSSPNSITVAVVPHSGATWFFKLSGNSETVAAQKPALLDFLKSVSFTTAALAAASPHGQSFASANTGRVPEAGPTLPQTTIPDSGKPSWTIPAEWKEVPPSQFAIAKFVIGGNDGEADVTVSPLSGMAGGTLSNVNRWRAQLGLAPIGEADLGSAYKALDVTGGKAMLFDMNGKSPKTGKDLRLLAVIWPQGEQTWFYKMLGDSAVAGREKDAFIKFVQSVHYPNG